MKNQFLFIYKRDGIEGFHIRRIHEDNMLLAINEFWNLFAGLEDKITIMQCSLFS